MWGRHDIAEAAKRHLWIVETGRRGVCGYPQNCRALGSRFTAAGPVPRAALLGGFRRRSPQQRRPGSREPRCVCAASHSATPRPPEIRKIPTPSRGYFGPQPPRTTPMSTTGERGDRKRGQSARRFASAARMLL
jgi:hypothetical protein